MTVSSQDSDITFSAGPATVLPLPFRFFNNSEVYVYRIEIATDTVTPMVEGADYTLAGAGEPEVNGNAESILTLTAPIATGFQVYVQRTLPEEQQTDIINQGKFLPEIHENVFDRLVMLIQQLSRGLAGTLRQTIGGLAWDFLGLRGINVGSPINSTDAATKGYVDTTVTMESSRAIRVAAPETVPPLPPAASRANLLLGFDVSGNPQLVAPSSGSAAALAVALADTTDVTKGAGQIGRASQQVANIAALRLLSKTSPSKFAYVTGYYAARDWEGALYSLDASDTTSADNGGTVIVAADGGRWKAVVGDWVNVKLFGAKGDGATDDTAAFTAALAAAKHVQIPTGATVKFTAITVAQKGIRITGPGALDGVITVNMPQVGDPYQSIVADMFFGGIRFIKTGAALVLRRGRGIQISDCTFENSTLASIAIQPLVADFDNANHCVEDVRIVDNFFDMVDRCLYIDTSNVATAPGFQWFMGCGDVTFSNNTARVAKITHVEADRVDGLIVDGNTMLHYGSASHVATKKRCVEVNIRGAQVVITGNQLFEPGLEAIYLNECTSSVISNNNIVQPGQVALCSAIKLIYSGSGYSFTGTVDANAIITGNNIYQPSLHGIHLANQSYVTATGNYTAIDNSNSSYYGDTLGQPAMNTVSKRYAVFSEASVGAVSSLIVAENNFSKQANAAKNPEGAAYYPFQKTRLDVTTNTATLLGQYDQLNLVQPAATTVTAISGGVDGKELTLIAFNGNTTLQNNATIKTKTGANVVLANATATKLQAYGGVWYQL